jgi:hypothetical protein
MYDFSKTHEDNWYREQCMDLELEDLDANPNCLPFISCVN